MTEKSPDHTNLVAQATAIIAGELEKLQPRTRNIVLAYVENPSQTREELATRFGCSTRWISKLLNSNRIIKLYKTLGKQKLGRLVPQSVDVYAQLTTRKAVQMEPGEARKAAETVLRETGVLGAPEIIVRNQLETASISDLQRMVMQGQALPGPIIDGEIVEDEQENKA